MAAPKGSKYALGNKGGRPAIFSDEQELQTKCRLFFEQCKINQEPPTISGLAYYLGFESRQSFYDYEKRDKFSYTIKRARLRIECEYEKALRTDKSPTGSIFALKNLGWEDAQSLNHSGEVNIAPKKWVD